MNQLESGEARTAAIALARSITNFQFLVTLPAVAKMSSMIIGLSRSLQKPGIDIIKALTDVTLVESALANVHNNSDNNDAAKLVARLTIRINKPRTIQRSVYRPNAGEHGDDGEGTQDIEAYYRIIMFYL